MNYPTPSYGVVAPPAKSKAVKIIIIVVVLVVVGIIILGAIGIALGVGLGVGLSNRDSDSSSSGSGTTTSILAAPSVTCTYGGSSTCGCSAVQPSFQSPKIVQGYTAVPNSWPWMVALYINNNKTFCGGFLISYQHVITAAHCVKDVTGSIVAYAGLQTLSSRNTAQARIVSSFTYHPDYSTTAFTNDIAVLTLASAFDQTSTVGKCCVTSDTSLPTAGEHGVIAGWGKTSTASSAVSNDLLQGVIQVLSQSKCGSSSASNIQFCAGFNGVDACFGDSGGPYMTSVNNSWTCTGIVSNGRGCGIATLYTRVSAYTSWINGVISG